MDNISSKIIPLVRANDSYGDRLVSPDNVQFNGNFKHNRHHPFRIALFADNASADAYSGKHLDDRFGYVKAQAIVISARQEAPKRQLDLANGDYLRFVEFDNDGGIVDIIDGIYQLRDDVALHDPMIYRVDA